jgi:hypothetical protein
MTITDIDITRLPDATLTPAERAWDAIDYMVAHPDEIDFSCWGRVHPADATRTVGCFAHAVVKRAGYQFTGIDPVGREWIEGRGDFEHVSKIASELLGLAWAPGCFLDPLFSPHGTLAERLVLVAERFGAKPVAA